MTNEMISRVSYWTPAIVLTTEQKEEWDRRLDGRLIYEKGDDGLPIPRAALSKKVEGE